MGVAKVTRGGGVLALQALKKSAVPNETALYVSLGIEIEDYSDAQSKLSREHLPKRSTQKP